MQLKTALHKSQNTWPTETSTNHGLATSTMKGPVPVIRGEGWIPLFFVEKVGLHAEPIGGAILIRLSVSTATPEKLRHWHGTTFSRYSLVHS